MTLPVLGEVLAVAPVPTVLIDKDGVIVSTNLPAAGLWRKDPSKLMGQQAALLTATDCHERFGQLMARCMSQTRPETQGFRGLRPNGEHFEVEFCVGKVSVREGECLWAVARPSLATAQNAAEPARSAASVEILANTAHELRTSLNAILGFTQLVADEKAGPLNARQKDYIADVHDSGRLHLQLINDLVQLVQMEAGRIEVRAERYRLSDAVAEVCAAVAPQATTSDVELRWQGSCDTHIVTLDRAKCVAVLRNLCMNALEWAGGGGRVCIDAICTSQEWVQLQVHAYRKGADSRHWSPPSPSDNGLDPRLVRTGSRAYLNLAVTRKLVEIQGGQLAIASTVDLSSTSFTVLMPTGALTE